MIQGYDGTIRFNTQIDDSELGPDLEKVKGKLRNAAQTMRDLMQGPIAAFNMVKQAVGALASKTAALEAEFAASETAVAILNATLKATGANSWTTAKAVQEMANKFQALTGYADDTILSMQNVLLGFKNIKGDNFEAASLQIINMAKVMRMDLSSAAQAVGKALDDPIAGIDSLTRQGFRWTQQEKELLKELVQTGKTAEAQKIIIDALATTFGGAAEAANNTASAIKDKLNVAQGELKEEMGRFLTEALKPLRQELIEATNRITEWFKALNENGNAPQILEGIAIGLAAVTGGLIAFFAVAKGHAIITALAQALKAVGAALTANPMGLIAAAITMVLIPAIIYLVKNWDEVVTVFNETIAKLKAAFSILASKIEEAFVVGFNGAKIAVLNLAQAVTGPVLSGIAKLLEVLGKLPFVGDLFSDAAASVRGFNDNLQGSIDAAKADAAQAIKTAKAKQDATEATQRAEIAAIKATAAERKAAREAAAREAAALKTNVDAGLLPEGIGTTTAATADYIPKGESQGERLKDLDTEYKARIALAERNGEDTAAIEKKWYEARNRLLAEFVVEDSKKGIALQDSLASSLKNYTKEGTSELRTLGDEIVATQQKLAELKSVDIEKVLEKYAPPTSGPYSAAGYKYARQVYEQFEKGVLQSTKLSESQIKDQIDAMASGQKYRDERKAYFDKIALDEDTKRIAYESLPALEAEFASKPGARGQSGLAIENYVSRDDFIEQLASQLDELQKEFTTPQYGQSGISPREGAGGASIADQIAMLSEQAEQIALAELEVMIAEYAVKPGSKGQSGITPEGVSIYGGDLADQLISEVIIPASLEAAQTGAMEYGKAYREGMAAWAKAKTVEDTLEKMWEEVLDAMEAEYKERKPTFGQSGVVPEGIKPASSIADQIREMQIAEADKQQERADIWAGSYERYLEEMAHKASFLGPVIDKIKDAWRNLTDNIKADADDWNDVLGNIYNTLEDQIAGSMETLGRSIVDGSSAWDGFGTSALRALAGVLRSVGYQLLAQAAYNAALGITNLLFGNIAGAAAAAASAVAAGLAATAAFVGAGVVEGLADQYDDANAAVQAVTDDLKEQNDALKENRDLFTKASKSALAYAAVLGKVTKEAANFFDSLKDTGSQITQKIIDGLTQGFSREDFLYSMQEYISESVIKAAVFTDAFVAEAAAIGKEIAAGIAGGFSSDKLQALKDRLAGLYEQAATAAQIATGVIDAAFGSYDVGTLNVQGDQLARIHNKEMILEPGIAEQARTAGIFIGPTSVAGNVGRGVISPAPVQFNITATGELKVDGREIGRIAWQFSDEFQGAAYGN